MLLIVNQKKPVGSWVRVLFILSSLVISLLSATATITGRQQQLLGQPYLVFSHAFQKDSLMLVSLEKQVILKELGNASNIAIVAGVITPNGTQVSGYGTISNTNHTRVDGNTIFGIGSVTKQSLQERCFRSLNIYTRVILLSNTRCSETAESNLRMEQVKYTGIVDSV